MDASTLESRGKKKRKKKKVEKGYYENAEKLWCEEWNERFG